MKSIDTQFEEIFGVPYNSAKARNDDALARDLNSLALLPDEVAFAIEAQIAKFVDGYKLTHSQFALVMLGVLVKEAGHCPVANVITTEAIEQTLRGLLDATAAKAEADVVPLLKASIQRIVGDDAQVVHTDRVSSGIHH